MRRIALVCLVLMLAFVGEAFADGGAPYVGFEYGRTSLDDTKLTVSKQEVEYDDGTLYGVALGYEFGGGARIEAETFHTVNDFGKFVIYEAKGNVQNTALMVNGYYDFLSCCKFRPFIMAGIGYAKVTVDDFYAADFYGNTAQIDGDDTVFAYQFGAGISYDITRKITLDLKYRYLNMDDPIVKFHQRIWGNTTTGKTDIEYTSQMVTFGLRYFF